MLKKAILSLAIGWTILIAILCLVKFNDLPSFGVSDADKYVHFTFHFVFTTLWGFYLWGNERALSKIVRLVIISLCYGILIEFLQETVTTTRHADIFDVLANLTGALFALGLFVLFKKLQTTR
ncbi:VanZ family protein [Flavobacterium paronense]|uniref:VanZ family protein n=1 Tax=Flavobacterium paronense TaxID=1392775 RepID=A0ABV5GH39_9FLAO|nr:VanZ family protein [Flavobacterium paronense]MDN3676109.1 VanZ family protein [Flavobacterium paronense]